MNKNRNLIIIILLVLVFGGVYYFYTGRLQSPEPVGVDMKAQREMLVKNPPSETASQEERLSYVTLLSDASVETNTVDINRCNPDPISVRVKMDSEITFVNNDEFPHYITFNPSSVLDIPAKSQKSIKANFGGLQGLYPYQCDSTERVGVVVIKN